MYSPSPDSSSLLPATIQAPTALPPGGYALAIPMANLPQFMGPNAMGVGPAAAPATRSIIIEDLFRCIFRRWKSASIIAALLAGLMLAFMIGKQPEYQADANLMLQIHDDKVFNFEKVVEHTGAETNSMLFNINNHRIGMKSRRFLDFFYGQLAPTERGALIAPPAHPTLVTQIMGKLSSPKINPNLKPEEVEKGKFLALCETANVDFLKETLIIKVSTRHHDAEQAALLANTWVKTYVEYVGHDDGAATRSSATFLQNQAEEARQRLQASEEALVAYCRAKGLVADAQQDLGDAEKLKLLSSEQARVEIELAAVQQTLQQVEAAGQEVEKLLAVDGFSNILTLNNLRAQLTEKLREKDVIEQRYLPKHPTSVAFHKNFEALNREISQALTRTTTEFHNKAQSLTSKVASLSAQTGKTKGAVAGAGEENIERKRLASELASNKVLYDKLLGRADEASVSSKFGEVTHLRVSEIAVAPEKPIAPSKPLSVVIAGVTFSALFVIVPLGMALLGILRVSGLEGLIEKFRASAQAPMPALAQTAASHGGLPSLMLPHEGAWLGEIPTFPAAASGRQNEMLFNAFRESSTVKHLFESTASHLLTERNGERGQAPVVFVTSTRPGEGKSLVASALGVATALQKKTVVVIDGNLRRPSLHRYFPREIAPPSLSEAAHSQQAEPWQVESLRYPGSNLFTLEAGNCRGLDVEHVFDSKWFAQLLAQLRTTVDLVILDAPSLCEVPESEQLALLATRAIVVGSAVQQRREDLQQISRRLCQLAPHLSVTDYLLNRTA